MFARSPEAGRYRPHVIIAHSSPAYAHAVARAFRRQGWIALQAADGPDARLAATNCPGSLIVLDVDLPGESGWLTCAKLHMDNPDHRVVLVAAHQSERNDDFAEFSGATRMVTEEQGPDPVLEAAGIGLPATQAV
ncbi:MAG: response regulator [Tepidisphaerales bacterium]